MRGLIQRVLSAELCADGQTKATIARGLLVYLGVATSDTDEFPWRLAEKVANLRIFADDGGKMNLSVLDIGGDVLAVPNFTLQADARKGRRPAFTNAAPPTTSKPLYEAFADALEQLGCRVARGVFGAHMEITSIADGPVNIVVDFPPAAQGPGGDE